MPKNITPTKPAPGKATKKQASIPAFENDQAEVRESGIHGLGLFARKNLRKGSTVGFYRGEKVTSMKDDGDHVLWIYDEDEDEEYGINGENETRFVNHSKRANANFNGEELIALRTIKEGEEITHDYGEAWSDLD
jgi:uncharacterized protein